MSGGGSKHFDPLSALERAELMARPRPRALPIAPTAAPGRRRLPLLDEARDKDRAYRPIYAVWELTLACDLACRHCGSRAGQARHDELTTAECLDLVHQLHELGVLEVTLIGGEAYLRPDWTQVVRELRKLGITTTMTTGGRGMTPERAREAFTAGLESASVSIDGLEATHDRLRGVNGSFRAALDALGNLSAAGVRVSCNSQINRLTMPELPELLERIAAAGVQSWQIALTVPMGRAVDEPEVLLQPYDLLELFPILAKIKKRCDELGVSLWAGNNVGYYGPYETLLRGALVRSEPGSCGAGRSVLGIEADGAIKGCPSLPTEAWTGGNIRDASLRDIWERSTPLRYTRDRTLDDLWGYCRTCYYADACRAGCTWTSFVFFGRPGNNPYCHHRALEMKRAGKRERLIRRDAAPGTPFDHGRFEVAVEDEACSVEVDMEQLVPCPGCDRHVRVSEQRCPFCEAELDLGESSLLGGGAQRLGRSALRALAFSAAGISVAAACNSGTPVAVYGGPGPGPDAGGTSSGGGGGAGGAGDGGAAGAGGSD